MKKDKNDYVSIIYDEKRTPKTNYPNKLIRYLSERFGLDGNITLVELGCGRGEFLFEFQEFGFDCKTTSATVSSFRSFLRISS